MRPPRGAGWRLGLVALLAAGCATPAAHPSASRSAAPSAAPRAASPTPSPTAAPRGLSNPGAAWDPASGLVLAFGGDTPRGASNESWGWDGATWRLVDDGSGVAPTPRDDAQLVADPERRVVVLQGGRTDAGGRRVVHSDTWEWDGAAWHERIPDGSPASPPPRLHPVAGWDPASRRVLYAGGVLESEVNATDTWAWDGNAWTQLADTLPDPGDPSCRMAWDPTAGAPVILALDLDAPADDPGMYATGLWRWSGAGWEAYATDGPPISPVQPIATMPDGLLLADGGGLLDSFATWTWDGETWHQPAAAAAPPARNGQSLVYDERRGRVVMFGGWLDRGFLTDVWEWDGSAWRDVTPE